MRRLSGRSFAWPHVLVVLVLCAITAACGTGSTGSGRSTSNKAYQVGFEVGALPMTDFTTDKKSFQGVNYDLMKAIAKRLGITFDYHGASWPSLLPGLQAGRYDLALSGIYDKAEREKVVDMVTYMNDGSVLVTGKSSNLAPTPDTLCGLTVGTQTGSAQAALLPGQSSTCVSKGKKPITVKQFDQLPASALALVSGRIDVLSCNATQCGYLIKTRPADLRLVGAAYDPTPIAVAVRKGSGLASKMRKAIQDLIDNGEYANLLQKWGLTSAAINDPKINPLTSSK